MLTQRWLPFMLSAIGWLVFISLMPGVRASIWGPDWRAAAVALLLCFGAAVAGLVLLDFVVMSVCDELRRLRWRPTLPLLSGPRGGPSGAELAFMGGLAAVLLFATAARFWP